MFPLAALVLTDDPEEFAFLAGFPNHLQRHPVAACSLVLELHTHRVSGQVHRRADEPPILALSPAVTLQSQEVLVVWGRQIQIQVVSAWETHPFVTAAPPSEGWAAVGLFSVLGLAM